MPFAFSSRERQPGNRTCLGSLLLLVLLAAAGCGSGAAPVIVFCSPDSPRMRQAIAGLEAALGQGKLEVVCIPELGGQANKALRRVRARHPRLLVVLGTPALLRLAPLEKQIPTVFGLVANPYFTGVVIDPKHPEIHQGNITGVASPPPLAAALEKGEMLGARYWGMLYDPNDGVSVELKDRFLEEAPGYGIRPLAAPAGDAAADRRALARLRREGARVIYLPPAPSAGRYGRLALAWGRERRVMVVSGNPEYHQGAILWITLDYRKLGEETATLARWVLSGQAPDKIPIVEKTPLKIEADDHLLRYWSGYPG